MRRLLGTFLVLLLSGLAAGAAHAAALVLVTEDGGYDPSTVQTIRTIAATELRVRGVPVTDDPRYHSAVPLTDAVLEDVAGSGVDRLFVVRLGRLGTKVMMSVEEVTPPAATSLFASTLMAENIEEADTVIPRLVRSVLERVPPGKTAGIATVTADESKEFRKKAGEGMLVLGLGLAPLGGSLGWSYEAKDWRLGAVWQAAEDDPPYFGLEGAWVPLDGSISPYAGGGIGVVWPASGAGDGEGHLGTKLDLGAEFFRLHSVRLFVGLTAVIPLERMTQTDDVNPQLWIRFGL